MAVLWVAVQDQFVVLLFVPDADGSCLWRVIILLRVVQMVLTTCLLAWLGNTPGTPAINGYRSQHSSWGTLILCQCPASGMSSGHWACPFGGPVHKLILHILLLQSIASTSLVFMFSQALVQPRWF